MRKWAVYFRRIAPYEYHTPMMYLPEESMGFEAESADQAWQKFLENIFEEQRPWYKKIKIEEIC